MRLDIGNYAITSDTNQLIVNEKRIITKEGSTNLGKESLVFLGSFRDLPQCGKFLVDHKVRISDATSFKELVDEIRGFRDEVMKALEI